MARFRKGTNDADNDGRKGGSLKAGSRFVKGTNDPDNDGHPGGSLPKGDDMAKAKKPAAKSAAPKVEAEKVQAPAAEAVPEAARLATDNSDRIARLKAAVMAGDGNAAKELEELEDK
jgi:hypothetical protein